MKKFFAALLAVVFVMAGVSLTAEAQTEAKYSFTVVSGTETKTEDATLSSLLTKYADSKDSVTIVAPYGVKDIYLGTSATIGKNVTVVLPCTSGQTGLDKATVNPDLTDGQTQTLVSSIVLNNKAKLTVAGALIVSGQTGRSGEIHNVVTGNYGELKLESGTSIVVTDGGQLHNYGYVTGAGKITAKSGAEIKDLYQTARFVGGSSLLSLFNLQGDNTIQIFNSYRANGIAPDKYPFPIPEMGSGNLSVQTKFEDGSVLIGSAKLYANEMENACEAMLVGEGGIYEQDGGYITKKSTLSADRFSTLNRELYQFSGKCKLGSTSVNVNLLDMLDMKLLGDRFVYPICGNTTLRVAKGATLTVDHAYKFLPGSKLEVKAGGTLKLEDAPVVGSFGHQGGVMGGAVNVSGESSTGFLVFSETVRGAYGSGTTPAKLIVDGTVDLGSEGYVFGLNENTLEIGTTGKIELACNHSQAVKEIQIPEAYNEEGVITVGEKETVAANWDYLEEVADSEHTLGTWKVSKSGKTHLATCTKCKEQVKSAVTKKSNGDGTHTLDCNNAACTIKAEKVKCTMDNGVVTKKPTCTKTGTKEGTCTVCKETFTEKVAALGHKYGSWKTTKKATCTATGSKYRTCTVCKVKSTATIAKLAHTKKVDTTKATLKKAGKQVTKCTVCKKTLSTKTVYVPKTIKLAKTEYTYTGKVITPSVVIKDSKGNTLKKNTDYTVKYDTGRKATGEYDVKITFKGKYSGTKTLSFQILPSATSKITTTTTTTTVKATWSKVTGATGYKVQLLNSKGKVLKTESTTKLTVSFAKLSKATTYKVKVTAYKTIDKVKEYSLSSKTATAITKPATPTLKVTAGTKKANLSWNKVAGTGYEILYATNSNFTSSTKVTVSSASTVKKTVSNLKKGKKYYFKVRAYKTVGKVKVYSAYSKVVSVKVK